jgi:hypothetical protein
MGIVLNCSVNRGNVEQYLVQLKDRDDWFYGRDLKTAPSDNILEPAPDPINPPWKGGPIPDPGFPTATAPEEPPNQEVREDERTSKPPDSE